ncbi:MAG: hypothetical protein L0220_17545, partial [Acidobacteria bacterium]|nr:hypothetical protein [Acidobacteriota bacterium]
NGDFDQMLLRNSRGSVLATQAGSNAAVAVFAEPGANLDLIALGMKQAAGEVGEVLANRLYSQASETLE